MSVHFNVALCWSACDDAASWLPAVCPKNDILFIQVIYPRDIHASKGLNQLGECTVTLLFSSLGHLAAKSLRAMKEVKQC